MTNEKLKSLRICKVCGLEARNGNDLEKFKKNIRQPYHHENICKICDNRRRREHSRTKKEEKLIRDYGSPILCYFCGEPITIVKGINREALVLHSLDGNHKNWDSANKVPAHKSCHNRYHSTGKNNPNFGKRLSLETRRKMSESRKGSKHPLWKGGISKNHAKYLREWRRRKQRNVIIKCQTS